MPARNVPQKRAAKRSKPAKRGTGAAKGAGFERLISRQLSLWLSEGTNEDLFWRSAGSGSRSTNRIKRGGKGIEYHASDIAASHPAAQVFADLYTVECKFYRDVSLHQLFFDPHMSLINSWWLQASRDAASVKKEPILIFKGNRLEPLIAFEVGQHDFPFYGVTIEHIDVVIYKWADFLKVSPHKFLGTQEAQCPIRPRTRSS